VNQAHLALTAGTARGEVVVISVFRPSKRVVAYVLSLVLVALTNHEK
jgi:hypothetical protein